MAKSHLKKVKKRAGNRYAPELNIDLPSSEIFDGISRTENFYTTIRGHYEKLNREFNRVSEKHENNDVCGGKLSTPSLLPRSNPAWSYPLACYHVTEA